MPKNNSFYIYHLTLNKNIENILKTGLQPKIGDLSKAYYKNEAIPCIFFASKDNISTAWNSVFFHLEKETGKRNIVSYKKQLKPCNYPLTEIDIFKNIALIRVDIKSENNINRDFRKAIINEHSIEIGDWFLNEELSVENFEIYQKDKLINFYKNNKELFPSEHNNFRVRSFHSINEIRNQNILHLPEEFINSSINNFDKILKITKKRKNKLRNNK